MEQDMSHINFERNKFKHTSQVFIRSVIFLMHFKTFILFRHTIYTSSCEQFIDND